MTTATRPRRKKKRTPANLAPPLAEGWSYHTRQAQRVVLIKDGKSICPAQVQTCRSGLSTER